MGISNIIPVRGVFMRLMYYEDYSRHGCLVKYFTQVRDPVDRFISRFNYNRKQTNKAVNISIKM